MVIGLCGGFAEIALTPHSAWASLPGLESLLYSVAVILVEYLLVACIFGFLWGFIVFMLQRATRSERPLITIVENALAGDSEDDATILRLTFLLTALVFSGFLMSLLYVINLAFLTADFHNMPLAAAALLCAGIAAAFVAFIASLPVFIVIRAALSHPFARIVLKIRLCKPWLASMVLVILAICAVGLVLFMYWSTVQRIRYYDAYLLAGSLAALAVILLSFKKTLIDNRPALLRVFTYVWPIFMAVGFVLILVLTENFHCRYITFEKTTLAGHLLKNIRSVIDFDMDGYPTFMGGGDCAPLDPGVYPDAVEIPGNGKDDNCIAGDRPWGVYRNSEKPFDVPEEFLAGNYRLMVISIDAARTRNMSLYGYKRENTKNITEWAEKKNAFIFDRAYCHIPATRWAIPLIFSSQYPSDIQWDTSTFPYNVGKSTLMLAEALNKHDFYTSAYWTAHKKKWGLDQGFDKFSVQDPKKDKVSGPKVTQYATDFLKHNKDVRFFLWLHYYEPHDPYISHKENDYGRKDTDNYDEEIWSADREIGKVFAEMESLGAWENTVVLLISDHGEGFMEHGQRHHSYQTYNEMTNIPMVWWIPGRKGHRIETAVGQLDIVPTILNLFGYSDGWKSFRGRSMAALFFGAEDAYEARPQFISTSWSPSYPKGSIKAVVDGDWKLIYNVPSQVYELYDLKADPLEQNNIFDPDLEPVNRLMPILHREMEEIKPNKTVHVKKK